MTMLVYFCTYYIALALCTHCYQSRFSPSDLNFQVEHDCFDGRNLAGKLLLAPALAPACPPKSVQDIQVRMHACRNSEKAAEGSFSVKRTAMIVQKYHTLLPIRSYLYT